MYVHEMQCVRFLQQEGLNGPMQAMAIAVIKAKGY
jgi:hypothetical protein